MAKLALWVGNAGKAGQYASEALSLVIHSAPTHLLPAPRRFTTRTRRVSATGGGLTTKYLVDTLDRSGYFRALDEMVSGAVTRHMLTASRGSARINWWAERHQPFADPAVIKT